MSPDLYWIRDVEPLRLAMMPRPRSGCGLQPEIDGWKAAGLTVVLCLLTPQEMEELELAEEAAYCRAASLEFLALPIPDRGTPASRDECRAIVEAIVSRLRAGHAIGIHCRAGIGRSGLVAGCILGQLGMPPAEIFARLSKARTVGVPDTIEQEAWVRRYCEELRSGQQADPAERFSDLFTAPR